MNRRKQQRFAENNERKISYYVCGDSTSKNTVFFLNGLYHGNDVWIKQQRYPYFQNNYKLIFMDYRGLGDSYELSDIKEYELDHISEDIALVMKKEECQTISLAGYSIGGIIAVWTAHKLKDKIEQLILLNTGIKRNIKMNTVMRGVVRLMDENIPLKNIFSLTYPLNHSDTYLEKVSELEDAILDKYVKYNQNRAAFKFLLKAIKEKPEMNLIIKGINIPVLIISADKDYVFPLEYQKDIFISIKYGKHCILTDCGHASFIEKHEEVNKTIQSFMERNQGRLK